MMYLLTLTQQILRDMWTQKLRSLLALFGIVWGTMAVVLLLALGHGFHEQSQQDIMRIAQGTLFMVPSTTTKSFRGMPIGRKINIKSSDILSLPAKIPTIQSVSPALWQETNISFGAKQINQSIIGTTPEFSDFQKLAFLPGGRFFNYIDVKNHAHVAVLGYRTKEHLYKNTPAIGTQIMIHNIRFTVIGVLQPPTRHMHSIADHAAMIPYTTSMDLWGDQNVNFFMVLPKDNVEPKVVENSLRVYFSLRYHFDPSDKNAIALYDTVKIFQFFKWFFFGIQLFLGVCGFLTLAVGGLGVANIMFLIVTERTKEIGIRMAIGANSFNILIQVLMEAFIIVALGGLVGVTLSYLTVFILTFITLPKWIGTPTISGYVIIITITILSIVGLLAGYFPARRAAKMDPVDALRGGG